MSSSARWSNSMLRRVGGGASMLDDRVVAEQIVPCWECRYCQTGHYWMCARNDIFGFKRRTPGAMAEYMIYSKDSLVHKVSKELPPAHAAFAEPLSCALHAVERAELSFDDVVVVAGCGPIGLGMIAGAKARNPSLVIGLDSAPDRLSIALDTGADLVINIAETDPVAKIKDLTGGYGADVYLEATGHPSAVDQGLNMLRKLGTYVEYGVFGSGATIDWTIIGNEKELDVRGAHLGPHCWPAAIRLIESGRLPMEKICTHQLPARRLHDRTGSGGPRHGVCEGDAHSLIVGPARKSWPGVNIPRCVGC